MLSERRVDIAATEYGYCEASTWCRWRTNHFSMQPVYEDACPYSWKASVRDTKGGSSCIRCYGKRWPRGEICFNFEVCGLRHRLNGEQMRTHSIGQKQPLWAREPEKMDGYHSRTLGSVLRAREGQDLNAQYATTTLPARILESITNIGRR